MGILDEKGTPRCAPFMVSLVKTIELCEKAGHEVVPIGKSLFMGCCYIQIARNELAMRCVETGADVCFFLDDDISWNPEDALRLIEMPDEIVAATYRYKTEQENYPVSVCTHANARPIVRNDGCIEATQVPTGFLRIRRSVFEKIKARHPERSYYRMQDGIRLDGLFDFFPQGLEDGQWIGEDYAFCRLWIRSDIDNNKIWVVPNITLSHYRRGQEFKGNYHDFLTRQPGGSSSKRLNLEKTEGIPGWMTLQESEWLAEQAMKHKSIVELGCCYGRSTRALADNTSGKVFAVDHWQGPPEERMTEEEVAKIWPRFQEAMKDHIESGHVVPIHADHSMLPELDFGGTPDMIFIDGAHNEDAVRRDIRNAEKRIGDGGLICGHDYNWADVKSVVDEVIPNRQLVPGTTLWFHEVPCQL